MARSHAGLRRARWVATALALVAVAGAGSWVAVWRPAAVVGAFPANRAQRISGVLHVHTVSSDGSGTVRDVVDAAKRSALDYVIITDHRSFGAKAEEGYDDKVLVIVGTEIPTRAGHLLAIGLPEPPFVFTDDPREVLEDISDLGGLAIAAHPDSPREGFRWRDWDMPGSWGIEIMNGDSQWRSAGWAARVRGIAMYPLNPAYALLTMLSPPDAVLRQWNRLLALRDTPVVIGTDAHGFPSYESLFALAQNHLVLDGPLTGDARADIPAVVSSLARGRGYVGLDALASAAGFSFTAEEAGRRWTMGDAVPATPAPRLDAGGALPDGAIVSLIHDDERVVEAPGRVELPSAGPGVYRVEVHLPGWDVPWIVSNPIYVFDDATFERRRRQASLPMPLEPPPATGVIDDFEDATVFQPGHDPSTVVAGGIIDRHAGADGRGAARLSFTLGSPLSGGSPFAALSSARPRDLSGAHGLVFSIRADHSMRVWVQVRDENSRTADGTEWWYLSVKASTAWRRLAVPFDRFRTREGHSDGRLDAAKTTGLFFIVDTGVARAGTRGTLWIDDVGVY